MISGSTKRAAASKPSESACSQNEILVLGTDPAADSEEGADSNRDRRLRRTDQGMCARGLFVERGTILD